MHQIWSSLMKCTRSGAVFKIILILLWCRLFQEVLRYPVDSAPHFIKVNTNNGQFSNFEGDIPWTQKNFPSAAYHCCSYFLQWKLPSFKWELSWCWSFRLCCSYMTSLCIDDASFNLKISLIYLMDSNNLTRRNVTTKDQCWYCRKRTIVIVMSSKNKNSFLHLDKVN